MALLSVSTGKFGVNCNRAVSFAPHAQKNYDVHVQSVVARGCSQGVIESDDEKLGKAKRGGFFDSTISGVTVISGDAAQNPAQQGGGSAGAWLPGRSAAAFARDADGANGASPTPTPNAPVPLREIGPHHARREHERSDVRLTTIYGFGCGSTGVRSVLFSQSAMRTR